MTTDDKRADYIEGLRQIADFLAEHPEVPLPHHVSGPVRLGSPAFYIYITSGDQRETVATVARAMGKAEKRADDSLQRYQVFRQFAGITLVASADRNEVCERVVTGTREVTVEKPDPAALAAVPTVTVTETVEEVEWVCQPLLAKPSTSILSVRAEAV